MTFTVHPKIRPDFENSLNYSDVFIVPDYSEVTSRKDVNISSSLGDYMIPVPVISANMESVTDEKMCLALRKSGALGALHRFQSIEENCRQFLHNHLDTSTTLPTLVSVGVNRDSYDRIMALYEAGARYFVIDIAHGHSLYMKETIRNLRELHSDVYIIAGNVATLEGARDLALWGADAVKAGIGPGSVCLTKNVTGAHVPGFESVLRCAEGVRLANLVREGDKQTILIADGGFTEIGDVCKALGCGANFIMTGKLLAACDEAPQGRIYRGSASKDVQETYRNDKQMPTPEGKSEILEPTGPVAGVIEHIAGGIRSAFSYVGAHNIKEFHEKCRFGIKHRS